MSFTMTATRKPSLFVRMCCGRAQSHVGSVAHAAGCLEPGQHVLTFSKVVLPLPRKPLSTVTGTFWLETASWVALLTFVRGSGALAAPAVPSSRGDLLAMSHKSAGFKWQRVCRGRPPPACCASPQLPDTAWDAPAWPATPAPVGLAKTPKAAGAERPASCGEGHTRGNKHQRRHCGTLSLSDAGVRQELTATLCTRSATPALMPLHTCGPPERGDFCGEFLKVPGNWKRVQASQRGKSAGGK